MDYAVDFVFEALFALTDLRVLLRETAPLHKFNEAAVAGPRRSRKSKKRPGRP